MVLPQRGRFLEELRDATAHKVGGRVSIAQPWNAEPSPRSTPEECGNPEWPGIALTGRPSPPGFRWQSCLSSRPNRIRLWAVFMTRNSGRDYLRGEHDGTCVGC